jgi:isopentenyl diphosphate isomerase/L-lactate dehydrogenase-like FMN-dependent dehydrogenase
VGELINTLEMEAVARRKLDSFTFTAIADDGAPDRAAFDRITFRPRLMVNTMELDLVTELFGLRMFAPIIAGPASMQQRFHPDAELAMARGVAASRAAMVITEQSSLPLAKIAAECGAGFWYQGSQREKIEEAVKSGCKAVCVSAGAAIDPLRKGLSIPFLLKGVMNAADARSAVERGVQGVIVSNYRGAGVSGLASSIEVLPAIVEAVGGRAPILIDGGFRRGSDILKAIALGARAVLVTRPVLWGLAAYGAPGVQHVIELLQTELARDMAMCGRAKIAGVDKSLVRIHRR